MRAELVEEGGHPLRAVGGEAGHRLVHEEDLGAHGERDGELELAALAVAEVGGAEGGALAEAGVVEEGHRRVGEAEVAGDRAEEAEDAALAGLDGEHDVLQRRHLRGDRGDLEGAGEADAGAVGGVEVVDRAGPRRRWCRRPGGSRR